MYKFINKNMENIQNKTYNFADGLLNIFSIDTTPLHFYIRIFQCFTILSEFTEEESRIANDIYLQYLLDVQYITTNT